eukprot:gb/GECG01013988.1/.p1 GENE.gb/GECG01013988.1/~~gb/GECG01013988.1/.p1  ORF type:complete len:278 (+),score=33.00 gb/GECG01013988.1/:1-834(+)
MMMNQGVSRLIQRQCSRYAATASGWASTPCVPWSGTCGKATTMQPARYFHGSWVSCYAASASDELWTRFQKAQEAVEQLSSAPDNSDKLKLYGLYKQATQGDNTAEAPSRMNMVKYAKWNAWNQLKSMSKEDAAEQYIATCRELGADVNGSSSAGDATTTGAEGQGSQDTTQFESLKITKEAGVCEIRFNRPAKKNAITFQMYLDIEQALNDAAQDDSISVAVLTGEGDFYSSKYWVFPVLPMSQIESYASTLARCVWQVETIYRISAIFRRGESKN